MVIGGFYRMYGCIELGDVLNLSNTKFVVVFLLSKSPTTLPTMSDRTLVANRKRAIRTR